MVVSFVLPQKHQASVLTMRTVGPYEVWSGSADRTICCWSAESYTLLKQLTLDSRVFCIQEIRAQGHIAAGCWSKKIYIYNNDYSLFQELDSNHTDAVSAVLLDRKGQLWSCSWDGSLNIWRRRNKLTLEPINSNESFSDLSGYVGKDRTLRPLSLSLAKHKSLSSKDFDFHK